MDYPYKKYFDSYKPYFELAKKYKPVYITDKNTIIKIAKLHNLETYEDGYILILTDSTSKYFKINSLTDYFTEECRVKCKLEKFKYSPYESFLYNYEKIEEETIKKYGKISLRNLNSFMEKYGGMCTNYKITYLLGILNYFKPKRWLDMSAGWGDRLASAILYDIDHYVGIDPNSCLHPLYKNMIDTLATPSKRENFTMINDKAESVDLDKLKVKSFDFIFTSPPFFTFEKYSNEESQSISNYNNVKDWLENFLFVSIDKAWKHLEINGIYALYIEDKPSYRFIKELMDYMNEKNDCIYLGVIHQVFYDPSYKQNPYSVKNVYVWKKV
jgi:16S rRNA G966 N2-methylase RsmD